ncbi:hypothetical protein DFJ74DRAFT_696625 [Hyaloraphidium curvatum]|nr:hypothetical protein DFJ74DRAFT_696625 [Hyaloraphidium curvatum]
MDAAKRFATEHPYLAGAAASLALLAGYRVLNAPRPVDATGKVVAVTGCDSGFGRLVIGRLAAKGYKVVAGFLTEDGMKQALSDLGDKVVGVRLDVTKQDQVDAFRAKAEEVSAGKGVWAVVNNAGIFNNFLAEATDIEQDKLTFEVNVFGVLRVTRAFLPLLRAYRKADRAGPKPRVVMISSVAGLVAVPRHGGYCASKWALEAYTSILRQEVAVFGIDIVSINPTYARTPIIDSIRSGGTAAPVFEANQVAMKNAQKMYDNSKDLQAVYPPEIVQKHADHWTFLMEKGYDPATGCPLLAPEEIVDRMMDAVELDRPPLRYVVTPLQFRPVIFLLRSLSDRLLTLAGMTTEKQAGVWPREEWVMA